MKSSRRRRWYVMAGIAVYGAVIAAVVVPGHGWAAVIPVEAITVAGAIAAYVWSGRDTDLGALIGQRADERQRIIRMKTQALVGKVMSAAVATAFLVAFAVKARPSTLWPLVILVGVAGLSAAAGLVFYRTHDTR